MIVFDGITFETQNELVEFLKHSYHAHKSRIKTLEKTLQETSHKTAGQATAERFDKLRHKLQNLDTDIPLSPSPPKS